MARRKIFFGEAEASGDICCPWPLLSLAFVVLGASVECDTHFVVAAKVSGTGIIYTWRVVTRVAILYYKKSAKECSALYSGEIKSGKTKGFEWHVFE